MKHLFKTITKLIGFGILALGTPLSAGDRPEHHEGKPAPTLEIALANMVEYNAKLEALIKKNRLSPEDIYQIHELSYTLENALETIGREQARLAELLEELHVASERNDQRTIKRSGRAYLEGTAPFIRWCDAKCAKETP